MRSRFSGLILAALVTAPSIARADGSGDELAAQAAFDEGRALMTKGDFANACPKFEASQRLSPGLGTLMNLGECYAKAGRTASAWITYKDAAAGALKSGQKEREQIARGRVQELEPLLCRLVVKPEDPAAAAAGVRVSRDGSALDSGMFGVGIPMDPGVHAMVISGEGKLSVERSVTVPAAQANCPETVFAFPKLADAPKPPPGSKDPNGDKPVTHEEKGFGTQKILAVTAGGLGVVSTAVGTVYALDAINKKNDAGCNNGCPDAKSQTLTRQAGQSADLATAFFITGGVLIAAGVVLWITAPSGEKASTAVLAPLQRGAIEF
jgi:serine/threonine-protein kinase